MTEETHPVSAASSRRSNRWKPPSATRSSVSPPLHRFLRSTVYPLVGVLALWGASCGAALPRDAVASRVIDGDTIELSDGRLLRYIGIDAPEVRRKVGGRWVVEPEPWAAAATDANRRLVDGQRLRLEYDVETRDRFGRLLAYVYVGDVMVNAELVRAGFAQPMTIPPNVKYAERFRAFADEARRERRGLWGS